MKSARDVARAVLRRVDQGEAYATLALAGELGQLRHPPDRALATELVYGVLRHRARLDRALAALAPRGLDKLSAPVLGALRLAAYQIVAMRVPAHAAVDDAVGAISKTTGPKVAGFANAILRKLASGSEPAPPAGLYARLEAVHSFPDWLARRLAAAVGEAHVEEAAAAFNRPPPVVFRATGDRDALAARILAERPDASLTPSPDLREALIARNAGAPETLAAFLDGECTVQDIAAQHVAHLVGPQPGERVLDACAGVGGKATHLAQLGAQVDAADMSRRKLDLAEDTIRRLRLRNVRTIVADLTRDDAPLAAEYDRVLLDAPCSGLGVLRRHPEVKWREPPDIAAIAGLQQKLLAALAPRVRPGGVLVYSVCTFTVEEGTAQIAAFLRDHADFTEDSRLTTFPHTHDADAFFAARLVRAG